MVGAALEHGEVDLRDRRAGDRLVLEGLEQRRNPAAQRALDDLHRHRRVERRHLVLQLGQLVGDVGRHQVAPRRQDLAELDEDRPQRRQRPPQALAARHVELAPDGDDAHQEADLAVAEAGEHQLVQAVVKDDEEDLAKAQEAGHSEVFSGPGRAVRVAVGMGWMRARPGFSGAATAAGRARRGWRPGWRAPAFPAASPAGPGCRAAGPRRRRRRPARRGAPVSAARPAGNR
ncbi:hypothetical protein D9M69_457390 [compost metagenome]